MSHTVINQYGRYIDGRERDTIIEMVMRDRTAFKVGNSTVHIVKHTVDKDGNKVTLVEVN